MNNFLMKFLVLNQRTLAKKEKFRTFKKENLDSVLLNGTWNNIKIESPVCFK